MFKTYFKTVILVAFVILIQASYAQRWSPAKANAWYKKQGWLVGCDFIPSTAINQLEMWQGESFDTATINRELGYAQSIGMNTARVFLHDLVWKEDRIGFKKRINIFLIIASRHQIKPIFVFFDDCWNPDPKVGMQPEPKQGVHNSGWVRSPSKAIHNDSTSWHYLEEYVKDILRTFKNDKRILMWDLYNEPGNSDYLITSLPLLKKIVMWAREENLSQPVTIGVWDDNIKELNRFQLDNSDVITFHNYSDSGSLRKQVESLKKYRRPLICTEWLARSYHSTVQTNLPVFKQYNVGCLNWGLVSGKTNTIYPWTSISHPFTKEPEVWHHDLFRKDGTAYDENELKLFRELTKTKSSPIR